MVPVSNISQWSIDSGFSKYTYWSELDKMADITGLGLMHMGMKYVWIWRMYGSRREYLRIPGPMEHAMIFMSDSYRIYQENTLYVFVWNKRHIKVR